MVQVLTLLDSLRDDAVVVVESLTIKRDTCSCFREGGFVILLRLSGEIELLVFSASIASFAARVADEGRFEQ